MITSEARWRPQEQEAAQKAKVGITATWGNRWGNRPIPGVPTTWEIQAAGHFPNIVLQFITGTDLKAPTRVNESFPLTSGSSG